MDMTAAELREVRIALRSRLHVLDNTRANCCHCKHFSLDGTRCQKFDAVPPREFQTTEGACPEWRYDKVPF